MKNKLFFKIFFNYVIIIFSVFILFILFSVGYLKKIYLNSIEDILKSDSYLINESIKEYIKSKNYNKLDKYVKNIAKKINIRITVIDITGKVLSDSEKNPVLMENHINRPEIKLAMKKNIGASIRYSTTMKEDMIYFARVFEVNGHKYFLRTSYFLKKFNKDFTNIRNDILLTGFILFILFLILNYIYSKKLYIPIKNLKETSEKVAKGNFDVKVILNEKDEFKDLADNFNRMIENLKKLFLKTKEEQKQLNTIIFSIDEGIIALDSEGRILFVNNGFKNIVNSNCVSNKYYWEFLMPPALKKIIEESINKKINLTGEVEINNKFYFYNIYYLKQYKQIILILNDISKIKEYETRKKDLIANVSHEIKTPLTAISGFAETAIENTKEKETKKYLEIILKNSKRLVNIISDLLLLSRIEHKHKKLEFVEVDLIDLFNNIITIFEKRIKEKNLKITLDVSKKYKKIFADSYLIEQLFINLIDNAIKYTEKGEIKITTYKKDDKYLIEISDTGIGIPESHIPYIFERFYVVDKSRSKEVGGTGLGLSIVKHIVNLHGWDILVESKINSGTKFTILIPLTK